MAKTVTYQIATEILREVTVQVPLLDEAGEPVMREVSIPVCDETGEPVETVTYEPVYVEELRQETETVLTETAIVCGTQEALEANLPIVLREADHGEYTVTGEFDPEADTADAVLNTLLGVTE